MIVTIPFEQPITVGEGTFTAVGEVEHAGHKFPVSVELDLQSICHQLFLKAKESKSRESTVLAGALKLTIKP